MICNDDTNCSLFDFMANNVGIKVLHPGGYDATSKLCSHLNLNEDSHVLDLACGVGTTSLFLAKKFNCKVTGIDISENLIECAKTNLAKTGQGLKVTFQAADAFSLPFSDETFDCIISQAFFILVDNKELALKEMYRMLKPSGYLGSLELGWLKKPPTHVYEEILMNTCTNLVPRMLEFHDWESFFTSNKFTLIESSKKPMPSGMLKLIKTEGLINFLCIVWKMISNQQLRKKMMGVQKTFKKYNNYFAYGIFVLKKQTTELNKKTDNV